MVTEEAQHVLDVLQTAELEIGEDLVRDGSTDIRCRRELRVERVHARHGDEPLLLGSSQLEEPLETAAEAFAAPMEPDNYHVGTRRNGIHERACVLLIF